MQPLSRPTFCPGPTNIRIAVQGERVLIAFIYDGGQANTAFRQRILAVFANRIITARFVSVRGTQKPYSARHGVEISIKNSVRGTLAGSAGHNANEDVNRRTTKCPFWL
jgi:hypothetical protein